MSKKEANLTCTTKISKLNLVRIQKLKSSGYEPNDYILQQALQLLEKHNKPLGFVSTKQKITSSTKISAKTLSQIQKLKPSGYEPNDLIIHNALSLLEKQRGKKK